MSKKSRPNEKDLLDDLKINENLDRPMIRRSADVIQNIKGLRVVEKSR
jgi:hypothetical protein